VTRPSALKKKRRRRGPIQKHITMPPDEATSSDTIIDEESTLSPDSSIRDGKTILDTEATNAPEVGERETEKEQEEYAQSIAALVDKRMFSDKGIPFVVILVIMGWIFIQDNKAEILDNWYSIFWTIQKCSFFLVLYIIFLVYRWAAKRRRA